MTSDIVKRTPVQKWWCSLTNKKRRWHSSQPYAFTQKDGLKIALSEREIATAAYAEIKRGKPPAKA